VSDLFGNPDPIIRIVDFEATGLEPDALVVEVGTTDLNAATREIGETRATLCRVPAMPPEVRAIHHIRASETADFPPYDRRVLYEEAARAGVYAWAAHNASFEERYLIGPLPVFCTNKAALRLWPEAPAHGVFALLYWLEEQGRVTFDQARAHPPHRAGPDSYATAVLLKTILDEGVTGRTLLEWTCEPRMLPRCPIGDWRGRPWAEVDWGFLDWILRKIDDPDIRFNASLEIERRRHSDER
tara:strand:+ start:7588 stop:8313 length:726 start_codon:yes stop_codon:yes gene_type:complete